MVTIEVTIPKVLAYLIISPKFLHSNGSPPVKFIFSIFVASTLLFGGDLVDLGNGKMIFEKVSVVEFKSGAIEIKDEFKKVMDIIEMIFTALDFKDVLIQISLRDPDHKEKYIGSEENWMNAENAIQEVAEERGIPAIVEYGEAAFYGPKMDFMVKDALGRKWQLGTIQVDYNLPERFDLEYVGSDNEKQRPVMIHRAPFGSMERFVQF